LIFSAQSLPICINIVCNVDLLFFWLQNCLLYCRYCLWCQFIIFLIRRASPFVDCE
jgi:hypothetical protein